MRNSQCTYRLKASLHTAVFLSLNYAKRLRGRLICFICLIWVKIHTKQLFIIPVQNAAITVPMPTTERSWMRRTDITADPAVISTST